MNAVARFQRDQGPTSDGLVGPKTLAALDTAAASALGGATRTGAGDADATHGQPGRPHGHWPGTLRRGQGRRRALRGRDRGPAGSGGSEPQPGGGPRAARGDQRPLRGELPHVRGARGRAAGGPRHGYHRRHRRGPEDRAPQRRELRRDRDPAGGPGGAGGCAARGRHRVRRQRDKDQERRRGRGVWSPYPATTP